jgi:peptidyl-prolyl cis-trans isomerase SurA
MKIKKKIFICLAILSCIYYATNVLAITKITPIDRIVAVVNNDVITESQLQTQIKILKNEMSQANMQIPPNKIVREKVLQQLINQILQVQIAQATGIRVSHHELNAALHRLAAQRKMTLSELYQAVQKAGWTIKSFQQQIRDQIAIEKLQHRDVAPRISISEQEVNDYLNAIKNRDQATLKEYHLQNILIPLPDSPSPEQIATAQQQAQAIIAQLKTGVSFNKLAITKSQGSKALQGGDLGWRKMAELPTVFAQKVKQMKPGDITGAIKTPNGIHILKLLGVRALKAPQTTNKQQVEQMIWQRKMDEAMQQFINTLHNQAYIKIMK